METLAEIYKRVCVDAGLFCDRGTVHSYIDIYETLLAPYRDTAKRVLEIGVLDGGGLLMFEQYFKIAQVRGIDCSFTPLDKYDLRPLIDQGHLINILDAANKRKVGEYTQDGIQFDLVIEDASHALEQQLQIFENFKPHLSPGALYIIEDIADLDKDRHEFESRGFEIIDRRKVQGRFDDVIAIFRNK